jgi:hypothetical protein
MPRTFGRFYDLVPIQYIVGHGPIPSNTCKNVHAMSDVERYASVTTNDFAVNLPRHSRRDEVKDARSYAPKFIEQFTVSSREVIVIVSFRPA